MSRASATVRPCGRGYVVLSVVAAGLATLAPTFAYNGVLQGLDLVEDLTPETIESMRADMSVNFLEAALLQATVSPGAAGDGTSGGGCSDPGEEDCSWPTYSITDVDGVLHTCTVRDQPPEKRAASKRKSGSKEVATALAPLEGRCATISHQYWSYRWCHRGEITQFHDNTDGTRISIGLGKHTRTEVKRTNSSPAKSEVAEGVGQDADSEDGWLSRAWKKSKGGRRGKKSNPYESINDFSELAAVFDFYEGGDVCEETGGHRQTRTSITCCATKLQEVDGLSSTPVAILVSIQEVSLCSYLVQVCSRLLCPALGDDNGQDATHGRLTGGGASASGGAAATAAVTESVVPMVGGVLGILEELEACFPPRRDGWWTYKLCFSTGITQYHGEIFEKTDGQHVTVISTEFSLGKWDRSSVTGLGEDLIRHREGEEIQGAIVLEFTGGTECDLTGVNRSTTVYLKCGSVQDVKELVEDRTCHYRLVAVSPLLCSHPALMPKTEPVRTVECVAVAKGKPKTAWK